MHPPRPAVIQPWWRRHERPSGSRSRSRVVVHVLLMAGLLAAILAI
jgi:hypothetical protein